MKIFQMHIVLPPRRKNVSLSRVDKLVHVAIIEGNIIAAKLIRLLQPCIKSHKDAIAYTDGKIIYVGEKFWQLPLSEQYFIVNHEFLHIILKHIQRAKDKDIRIYNIAADIIINKLLCERGRAMPNGAATYDVFKVPIELETTEKVYGFLLENINENNESHNDLIFEFDKEISEEILKKMESLAKEEGISNYSDQISKEQIISMPQDFKEKVDWFDDLMCEIGRLAVRTNIKTYNRPPRIKISECILRGGFIEQNIPKINIIIDVSGSMEDRPLKIAAKIHIMQNYLKIFKPNYYWLNHCWGIIDDITKIPLGGGTNLSNVEKIIGADLNVLITDCEDEEGIDTINNSINRFYVVTNNFNTKIIENHNHKIFKTINF